MYSSFNIAHHYFINERVLDEISAFSTAQWNGFSEEEFIITITKCNNSSAPGPDKLSWSHLKHILKDKMYLHNVIKIVNSCFNLGFWPSHFKISTTIVILKSNKILYDSPKVFRPIVLLNTLGKLIEKVIGERLQFHSMWYQIISFIKANLVISNSSPLQMLESLLPISFKWDG